jgi:hypothetical protein
MNRSFWLSVTVIVLLLPATAFAEGNKGRGLANGTGWAQAG